MIAALQLLQTVVLVGGTVHTQVPGEPPRVAKVLVHEGRIAAVTAPGEPLPPVRDAEGALVVPEPVDVSGMHLVPGLIDGMVNHDADHDALYTASGVTLVRDQANDLARVLAARAPAARDATLGPALFVSGEILDGAPPVTTASVVITSVAEAEDKIPRYVEQGIDYLSFYQGLGTSRQGSASGGTRAEVLAAVARLAHERGVAVWGPRLPGLTLAQSAEAGQDGLFYLDGLLPEGQRWDTVSPGSLAELARGFPDALALTPGMRLYSHRIEDPGEDPPELAVLGPHYAFQWTKERDLRKNLGWQDYVASGARVVALQRELLADLAAAGKRLVPGSGAPNPWILPGVGLHDELADWRRAGLSTEAILAAVTAGAARALGVDDERGTLEVGKIADVVVVRGDPLADLETLRTPEYVVLRGRLLPRAQLDRLVDALVERIAELRAEASAPIEIEPLELPEGEVLLSGVVENVAHDQRISSERYAVVRRSDESLEYLGRLVTPASATYQRTVLDSRQRFVGNKLEEFEAEIRFDEGSSYRVEGQRVGGNMRLRQSATLKGSPVTGQNTSVSQEIAALDLGSVTTYLALARHQPPGRFNVLYLENLDPILGGWTLQAGEDWSYLLQTSQGAAHVVLDARGVPQGVRRAQGTTVVETRSRDAGPAEEPGLELPRREVPAEEEAVGADDGR